MLKMVLDWRFCVFVAFEVLALFGDYSGMCGDPNADSTALFEEVLPLERNLVILSSEKKTLRPS